MPAPPTTATSPPASSLVITQADSGKTFNLAFGSSAVLQLSSTMKWSNPEASSTAVTLTPVTFQQDPGYKEWKINVGGRGQATIKSTGSPNCQPGMVCAMYVILFSVTINVA